jgi:hypothetical protein
VARSVGGSDLICSMISCALIFFVNIGKTTWFSKNARLIFRICRPSGALNFQGSGFYKYVAPTALGRLPEPETDFAACSAVGATHL